MANLDVNGLLRTTMGGGSGLLKVSAIEEEGDGYIRYQNGLQICWAKIDVPGTSSTIMQLDITLPKAFQNTDYGVCMALAYSKTSTEKDTISRRMFCSYNRTKTSFSVSALPVYDECYIAIGYWK